MSHENLLRVKKTNHAADRATPAALSKNRSI
jgi:hypothetical protein